MNDARPTAGASIYQASITTEGDAEVREYVITQVRKNGTIRIRAGGGRSSVPFVKTNLNPAIFQASPVRRDCIDLEAVASRDPEASRAARDEMSRLLYVPAMPVVLCGRCRRAGSP